MVNQLGPGFSAQSTDTPSTFMLGDHVMKTGIMLDSSARDSGNTPTTTLRPGLALGKITASGKYKEYDPSASDGSEVCVGFLEDERKVLDADGVASDNTGVLVFHGFVDESAAHGLDDAAKVDLQGQIVFG